jgi:hypothetical protein
MDISVRNVRMYVLLRWNEIQVELRYANIVENAKVG